MTDRHTTWRSDEVRSLKLSELDERFSRYRLAQPKQEQHMIQSIERYGQISPIVVCLHDADCVVIDGFKRLRAARTLKGFTQLDARRMDVDEQGAKAAIYQLNRIGSRPAELEEAWIVHALVREDGLSQVEKLSRKAVAKLSPCQVAKLLPKLLPCQYQAVAPSCCHAR